MGLWERIKLGKLCDWINSKTDALILWATPRSYVLKDLGAFLYIFLVLAFLAPTLVLKWQAGIVELFTKEKHQ